jgi:hypothetical protein
MQLNATSALWLMLVALFGALLVIHYGHDKDPAQPAGGSRSPAHQDQ